MPDNTRLDYFSDGLLDGVPTGRVVISGRDDGDSERDRVEAIMDPGSGVTALAGTRPVAGSVRRPPDSIVRL